MVSSTDGSLTMHGLEAALERGVLLDVLAVLVERGRAHAAELAAGQGGLEHVGRVHRALRRARADQRVQLVDEADDLPFALGDLAQDGLQAVLELAAVLGARHHGPDVDGEQALALEPFRHVAAHDALGEALDDGGLADAGLADEHGVVLGPPGEHLDDAADLLVPPDDRDRACPCAPDRSGPWRSAGGPGTSPRGWRRSRAGSRARPPGAL